MKKRVSPLILVPLILLCLAAAVYGVFMLLIPALESVDRTPVEGSADWMAALSDDRSLAELVIPGTHDCATAGVQLAYFSRCQVLGVGEQLEAGFRYLDVRLAVQGDRLRLMHGFVGCTKGLAPWSDALYLEDVLSDCYAFLDAHPGETILFAVKKDHGDESEAAFSEILLAYTARDPERWYLADRIPTLSETRGKLVLLHRYTDADEITNGAGLPLYWAQQDNRDDTRRHGETADNGIYTIWVQDRYKYDAADKYAAFLAAQNEAGRGELSIHFLSTNGNTSYGHPASYAGALNPRLLAEPTRLHGWVIVDYGSPALAQRIYRENG